MEIKRATVHEEHLETAKFNLKETLKRLCDANKHNAEIYRQLLRMVIRFDDLKLAAKLRQEHVRLDIGLQDNDQERLLLELGQDQARDLMLATDPQEYLALCEEALLETIASRDRSRNLFDKDFPLEIQRLLKKLGDIQTAQGVPADRNLMYVNFNETAIR